MDIIVKNYNSLKFNQKEILRYAGMKGENSEITKLLSECLKEIDGKLNFSVCYKVCDIDLSTAVDFGFFKVNSKDLSKNLQGYNKALIFVGFY